MGLVNGLNQPQNSHVINHITLINYQDKRYDLTQVLSKLTIYESLYSDRNYQQGTLVVLDSNALHINLPIVGQEWLEVSFQTRLNSGSVGQTEFVKRYKITQVHNLQKQKDNNYQTIWLDFVSEGMWLSESNLISKSYKQTLTSDMVTDLMQNALGLKVDVEPTLYPRDWVIPNITAFEFITRLSDESTSKQNLSSNYKFFENINGWNFKSLYTLSQAEPTQRVNANIDNVTEFDRLKADSLVKNIHFDLNDRISGGYQITLDELDTIQKRAIRSNIGYDQFVQEFPTMNSEKLYVGQVAPEYPTDMHYRLSPGNSVYQSNRESNVNQKMKRIMSRTMLESSEFTMKIPGNIDLALGSTVYFDFRYGAVLDHTSSGKYLLCMIKHEITTSDYFMTVNIRKDSNVKGDKIES